MVAHEDNSNSLGAAMLQLEFKEPDHSAELQLYAKGGDGFGMRKDRNAINE